MSKVLDEVRRSISKADETAERLHSVLNALLPANQSAAHTFAIFVLETRLEGAARKLMSAATFVEEDESCFQNAMRRVISKRAPAEQGTSVADCVILEHCLAISAQLSAQRFSHPVLFVSSNKDDYGTPGKMPQTLQDDFDAVGLQLAMDLEHARAICNFR